MTNVVMIALDDLFNVMKYRTAFGVTIETPNIDRLAAMGATYDNAYASIAVCNASRTSVMAGQSPFKTGIHLQGPEQWNQVMAPEDTLVGVMGDAGFTTYGSGKTYHNQTRASDQGIFEALYDNHFQSDSTVTTDPGRVANAQGLEPIKDDENVDWAIDQLEAQTGDPFFMTVGIIRPHRPFVVPQEYFDLYPQSDIVLPTEAEVAADLVDVSDFYKQFRLLDNFDTNLQNNGLDKEFAQGYLASITYADAQIGDLLDAIEGNSAIAADTAVVLWSDHGYHLGSRDTWHKFTLWEEAANAPLIIAAPGISGGTVVDAPVSLVDLFPTVLDIADVAEPSGWDLDGRSLLPVGADPLHPDWADSSAISSMVGSLSIRTNTHRLVFYNDATVELYDLDADPGQITNLATDPANQSLIDTLKARLVTEVQAQGGQFDPDALTLTGTTGDDLFFVTPTQTVAGGDGDDYYFVSDGATVEETATGGYDTVVFADFDFTIPDNVEYVRNSVFSNNIPFNVTGNEQDNEVFIYLVRGNVHAGAGDDSVTTFRSRDFVDGETGDDFIRTIAGTLNTLIGSEGDDTVLGGLNKDVLFGDREDGSNIAMAGHDVIVGDVVVETDAGDLFAGKHLILRADGTISISVEGNFNSDDFTFPVIFPFGNEAQLFDPERDGDADTIVAGHGDDIVVAQGGDDSVDGGVGNDTIFGQLGDDILIGRSGNDTILGGAGNDTIMGHSGVDDLRGFSGDDNIHGGGGGDTISGSAGDDSIWGESGADSISAGSGNDYVSGGLGSDRIAGAGLSDVIAGEAGNDTLFGGLGLDTLFGGTGSDTLSGQGGADALEGGAGSDLLIGGAQADAFTFMLGSGHDTIADFQNNLDTLALDEDLWGGGLTVNQVISTYAVQSGPDVLFDFGGSDRVTLKNFTVSSLNDDIDLV